MKSDKKLNKCTEKGFLPRCRYFDTWNIACSIWSLGFVAELIEWSLLKINGEIFPSILFWKKKIQIPEHDKRINISARF